MGECKFPILFPVKEINVPFSFYLHYWKEEKLKKKQEKVENKNISDVRTIE